jgi:hypothetical protein
MTSTKLATFCYYRVDGVFCRDGYLHHVQKLENPELQLAFDGPFEPVLLEGQQMPCPACNGLGRVPTDFGKEVLAFIEMFARPLVQKIVEEALQERK